MWTVEHSNLATLTGKDVSESIFAVILFHLPGDHSETGGFYFNCSKLGAQGSILKTLQGWEILLNILCYHLAEVRYTQVTRYILKYYIPTSNRADQINSQSELFI